MKTEEPVKPKPIEMSKIITTHIKNMLKETKLAQKKIRADKHSKIKLKIKQSVRTLSKAGANTSRTNSSIPEQTLRMQSSRS